MPIIIFGVICIILSTKHFLWDSLPISARIIQFPWRFGTFAALSISIIAPLCLKQLYDKKIAVIFLSVFLVLVSLPMLNQHQNILNLSSIDYSNGLGWQQEYLPVRISDDWDYYNARGSDIELIDGVGKIEIISDNVPKLEFKVETKSSVIIELPRIYYLGYTLKNNNKTYELYESEKGFIETKVESGTYKLEYTGTKIDKICDYISIISLIGCVIFIWKRK